jgi:hypothetical protein
MNSNPKKLRTLNGEKTHCYNNTQKKTPQKNPKKPKKATQFKKIFFFPPNYLVEVFVIVTTMKPKMHI